MNETETLKEIKTNEWINWEGKANVYYWNYSFSKRKELIGLIKFIKPDTIFINGLYSLYFNLLPLWYSLKTSQIKVVWSARGMLHGGALAQKAFKKKIFLFLIKLFRLHKKVVWHATDEREVHFIKQTMGDVQVKIAGNYPNLIEQLPVLTKNSGQLVLGTVALISPMKNHKAIIEALHNSTVPIKWMIYGPVKDDAYWKECLQLIRQLPSHIEVVYEGELPPTQLTAALSRLHVFVLPSESENFGHAILEALSAGKPVITTVTTPFYQLAEQKAGMAVSLQGLAASLTRAIQQMYSMPQDEYEMYCVQAAAYARDHVSTAALTHQYEQLFSFQP
ncbi:MAG TPA: glycosyltransferase [Lacibacter sp.]|nr:glycosyltransferase [Lacibacter sp.]